MNISNRYYTGREVQKILSITEPSLRNLVNQKKVRKIIPPGRKNGVYLKSEVDTFAMKWEAFLMSKEPPKATFHIATMEDMEAENDLDKRAIGGAGMTAEVRKAWLAENAECDYHVRFNNKLVAMLRLLPLKHETIIDTMKDKIKGVEIPAGSIQKFETGKEIEFYVITIASEPDVDEETRMHYMFVLIRGVAEQLEKLGEKGEKVTKVYAKTEIPKAIAMAMHLRMEEQKELRNKKMAKYILDVKESKTYLAQSYRKGFRKWQSEQERLIEDEKVEIKGKKVETQI